MSKYIAMSDLKRKDLQMLPIRRGCTKVCACLGVCMNVVGYVSRIEYDNFVESTKLGHLLSPDVVDKFLNEKCNP